MKTVEQTWYVQGRGGEPLGPFEEERIVRGILAGKVPLDASVSPAHEARWQTLLAVPVFAAAVHQVLTQREEGTQLELQDPAPQPSRHETAPRVLPSRPAV